MSTNLTSATNLTVSGNISLTGTINQTTTSINELGLINCNTITSSDNIECIDLNCENINIISDAVLNNVTINGLLSISSDTDITLYNPSAYDLNLLNTIKFTYLGVSYVLTKPQLIKLLTSASTTYVDESILLAISNLVNSSPATLDTLKEISTALNNDPNFYTSIISLISEKTTLSQIQSNANTFTGNNSFNGSNYINGNIILTIDNVYKSITSLELSSLDNIDSNIQDQLDILTSN